MNHHLFRRRRQSWAATWVACLSYSAALAAQQGLPPANVVATALVQREVAAAQSFVGQVIPSRRSIIGSAVDGRVVSLLCNDGDRVSLIDDAEQGRRVGQPIVQLLTETISIEIAAAKALVDLRQRELEEMLNGSRPEEITQARARLEASKVQVAFQERQFVRAKSLFENKAGSAATKEEVDEAETKLFDAQQNLLALTAACEMVEQGPRAESKAQAQARLSAAQEELRRLEDQLRKYTIRAPFEGYVVSKMTEVGAWLKRGDPVAEVVALDPIEIDVAVPETYIPHVRLGADATVMIEALPQEKLSGKVVRIVPQADLRSRSFPVKISVKNPATPDGHLLKAGMLARVTLAVGPRQLAWLVPKDALVLGGPVPGIMVVATDEKSKQPVAQLVPVQLGITDGTLIQILGDLRASMQVIVVGNERIRPGQPIAVQFTPAAAARKKQAG